MLLSYIQSSVKKREKVRAHIRHVGAEKLRLTEPPLFCSSSKLLVATGKKQHQLWKQQRLCFKSTVIKNKEFFLKATLCHQTFKVTLCVLPLQPQVQSGHQRSCVEQTLHNNPYWLRCLLCHVETGQWCRSMYAIVNSSVGRRSSHFLIHEWHMCFMDTLCEL